jgi:hypothetical protein
MLVVVRLREGELIEALRCNVRDLQRRLDQTRHHVRLLDGARAKYKRQLDADRVYLQLVKEAAWAVVNGRDILGPVENIERIDQLELVLQGKEPE